jgi:excisionase family DNA binding protein
MEPHPNPDPRPFYSVADVARLTGFSESHIRKAIKRGEMPGRRVGERYSIAKRAFHEWEVQRERQTTSPTADWGRGKGA